MAAHPRPKCAVVVGCPMHYTQIIATNPGILSGKPCIRDTRMTVTDVLEYLACGMSEDEILADAPRPASIV